MRDLTVGKPRRVILYFALPIMIGRLLQLCYSLADTRIVSSLLGEDALSAVGATTALSNMVIGFLNGLSIGFTVIVARFFGAKDDKGLKRSVALCLVLGLCVSLFLTVVTIAGLPWILHLLNTPEDIYELSYQYVYLLFLGMTMSMLYNVGAGILRAIGDTLTPMVILFVSVVLNIAGDILSIQVFDLGVRGAAIATVLSQTLSALCCFFYMWKRYPLLRIGKEDFHLHIPTLKDLTGCGLSMGFMSCLVNIGTVSLQYAINDLGKTYIVAHTAARKITEVYMMMFSIFGSAIATYCSQNYGAKKEDRITEGVRDTLRLVICWCILMAISAYTIAPFLIHLVAGNISPESIDTAALYLRVNTPLYFVTAYICILRNALQGVGDHITPVVSSSIECIGKVLIVIILVPFLQYWGIILSEPIVWFLMVIPLLIQSKKRGLI